MGDGPIIVSFGEVLWDRMADRAHLGGAPLNMVAHAVRCGARGYLVSAVGDDALGRETLEAVRELGVSVEFVGVDRELPTGVVDVQTRADGEPEYTIADPVAWDRIAMAGGLLEVVGRAQVLAVNTLSARSDWNLAHARRLMEVNGPLRAMDLNLRPPFVDDGLAGELAGCCEFVKANRAEACLLTGVAEDEADEAVLEGLMRWCGCSIACLTLGARGALLKLGDEVYSARGPEVVVADTVGAGDAFLGSLLTDLGRQRMGQTVDLGRALEKACRIGAYVASQRGAIPPFDGVYLS